MKNRQSAFAHGRDVVAERPGNVAAYFLALAWLGLATASASGAVVHRYSFDEPSGAFTVSDSVGGADGMVEGGAEFSGGTLVLDGIDGYVDLPNGIISALSDATFEAWVTFDGGTGAWQRIFDFGTNLSGEDAQGEGTTYLFLTPRVGTTGTLRFALRPTQGAPEVPTLNGAAALPVGEESHVAVTYDFANQRAALYVDGEWVAFGPVETPLNAIDDLNNWLGRSNWPDAYFLGSFNEFRIYDTALSSLDVALSGEAGPETLEPGDPGVLQSLTLTVTGPMLVGSTQQATATAEYANLGPVTVTADAGTTYESSDPAVVTIDPTGMVTAVGAGTATLTARHGSEEASQTLEVSAGVAPPAELRHRYSFDEPFGFVAADSVGDADADLIGADFTGDGKVDLDQFQAAYVDLPNGIISALTDASFEVWFTFDGEPGAWQRVFDFGNNVGGEDVQGEGTTYLFLTARVGTDGVLRFAATLDPNGTPREIPILDGPVLPIGEPVHVAVTYGVSNGQGRLYYNGALVATGEVTLPLSEFDDVNNWLGRSNWPDADFDGQIDEFRVYEGILTELQVALNAAAGPDTLDLEPGDLQGIRVQAETTELTVGGLSAQVTVLADFDNVAGVNVTRFTDTSFTSSDTSVVTVTDTGGVSPVGLGTATVTASYGDQQGSIEVRVGGPVGPPAQLIHRYSFSEAPGSITVQDSVGSADGFLSFFDDPADFTGDGKLTLGGVDAFVDLPNGLISSIPSGSASFEAWVSWDSTRTWERIFDFGNSTAGEDNSGTGETYLFLSPQGGPGVLRFAMTTGGGGAETPVLDGDAPLSQGDEAYIVVTYNTDPAAGASHLYVNGQRVDSGPATTSLNSINDINNWLGRSQWNDPYFTGQFNEFRIYDGVLTDEQIAISAAAGPDIVGTMPGALQALHLELSPSTLTVGGQPGSAKVLADFAQVQNVDVTTLPATQFFSSAPEIATIDASGVIQALQAGTATLRATYGGQEATAELTVDGSGAAQPTLSIALSDQEVLLSWPTEPGGFVLESTAQLGPAADWAAVEGTARVENGTNHLELPVTGTSLFIRLRKI